LIFFAPNVEGTWMHRTNRIRTLIILAVALSTGAGSAVATGRAHEHGALKLDVAVEGNQLTVAMAAPLDNLLGFERAPRTEAERKAAADVLMRLRNPDRGAPLFSADAAAQCTLRHALVQAPVLEPAGTKPAAQEDHADLDAIYEFVCARPDELRVLEVALFDTYRRVQRIDAQVAGPRGQIKVTLERPAQKIPLGR
jgi:Protein of unknown function (DUF2796)